MCLCACGTSHDGDKCLDNAVRADGPDTGGAVSPGAHDLENTGERYLPGADGTTEQAYDHISRYRLAERYVEGKEIVDMGCGAGYGSHALSAVAQSVTGVDLSEEAVSYATHRYRAPNLRYGTGDVTNLPYRDGTFEAAVSFEVIEHLPRPEDLVVEAKRLLKDTGIFVVSTPDKQTYRNERKSKNPHHLKEMYALEFREILERHFEHVRFYLQGALAGSIITPEMDELPEDGRISMESAQFSLPEPRFGQGFPTMLYLIAVCTNGEAPKPIEKPHLILDRDRQIYEEHLDWDVLMRQMDWFHDHKHRTLQWRIRQLENQLKQSQNRLDHTRNQLHQSQNQRQRQKPPPQGGQSGGAQQIKAPQPAGPRQQLSPRERQLLGMFDRLRRSPAAGPLRKALAGARRVRGVLRRIPRGRS